MEYIEGIYKNDILEGAGKIVYASGDKLICEFVNGVPNGPGKLFDPKGQLKQVNQKQSIWFIKQNIYRENPAAIIFNPNSIVLSVKYLK